VRHARTAKLRRMSEPRDFSTISPSAKSLLLVKAQTTLPYARQAADLLFGADAVEAARRETDANPGARGRRAHFEKRARGLDEALAGLGATQVLELAAGLSMRGLAMVAAGDIVYLDTDLPAIAVIKAELVAKLHPGPTRGTLCVKALDALDAPAFQAAVGALPHGPIAVVHEGLLMYLNDAEKARLAANVRTALRARGGAWLTADVYVRNEAPVYREERTREFLEKHRVDEQKFASFDAAEAFFRGEGFEVARKLVPKEDPWPVRQTWVLEAR
jgi:O-methyltransferase involved in polyketide biosynthesis